VRTSPYRFPASAIAIAAVFGCLVACSNGPSATVAASPAAAVVKLPPGVKMTSTDLAGEHWKLTPAMRRTSAGPGGSVVFAYVGTGKAVDNELASLVIPVSPGVVYVFSAWADTSSVLGQANLIIDTADGSSTYASVFKGPGKPGRIETSPWRCPPGVTKVLLGMQLAQNAVKKGQALRYAEPRLGQAVI